MHKTHSIPLDRTTSSGVGKKVVIEIDSREIKVVHLIADEENEPSRIQCTTFWTKENEEFFTYMEQFDDDWDKVVLKTSSFEAENTTRQDLERRLKARKVTSKTKDLVLALKTLNHHCPRSDWIHFAAFVPEHREKMTYPEFYELAISMFEGEQVIDDSELRESPALLNLFGEANQSVYIDGDKFSDLDASGFNSSYLLGMAQVLTNCETMTSLGETATSGTSANTSWCIQHFDRMIYGFFDGNYLKLPPYGSGVIFAMDKIKITE